MRTQTPVLAALAVALAGAAACSSEIGDSCTLSTDCSPNGDRFCDNSQPGGYCTIAGCDSESCPGGSVCVRFFSVGESNISCETQTDCSADEFCTIGGTCVPRSAETRWCMQKCKSDGACRSDYECRDRELMELHGGEPVPPPGESLPEEPQGFCAAAPLDDG